MALYRKIVTKGMITNKLEYRGHEFVEIWMKDGVLMCKGSTIETQINHIFGDLGEKELEIIESLGSYTDFDLQEKIMELSDYEKLYEVENGSRKEVCEQVYENEAERGKENGKM